VVPKTQTKLTNGFGLGARSNADAALHTLVGGPAEIDRGLTIEAAAACS